MTSIHCTDCPNYDKNAPTICCSAVISPKSATPDNPVVGYYVPPTARPADSYFDVENWGNN